MAHSREGSTFNAEPARISEVLKAFVRMSKQLVTTFSKDLPPDFALWFLKHSISLISSRRFALVRNASSAENPKSVPLIAFWALQRIKYCINEKTLCILTKEYL